MEPNRLVLKKTDDVKSAWMKDNIVKGMTVVDAGACIGKFTTLFSSLVGYKSGYVVAYEPREAYFLELQEKIMAPNVTCINAAVGNYNGTGTLYLAPKIGWDSMVFAKFRGYGSTTIPVVTLDTSLSQLDINKIDILKIDVEGWEMETLLGAEKIINNSEQLAIILEVHNFHTVRKKLLNHLLHLDFKVYELGDYENPLSVNDTYHDEIIAMRGENWINKVNVMYNNIDRPLRFI